MQIRIFSYYREVPSWNFGIPIRYNFFISIFGSAETIHFFLFNKLIYMQMHIFFFFRFVLLFIELFSNARRVSIQWFPKSLRSILLNETSKLCTYEYHLIKHNSEALKIIISKLIWMRNYSSPPRDVRGMSHAWHATWTFEINAVQIKCQQGWEQHKKKNGPRFA